MPVAVAPPPPAPVPAPPSAAAAWELVLKYGGALQKSEGGAAVLASGGSKWLLAALWLRKAGWRWPFLLGWLVALGLHEVFDAATSSLLGLAGAAAGAV